MDRSTSKHRPGFQWFLESQVSETLKDVLSINQRIVTQTTEREKFQAAVEQ
jgi:hypothetical protein